MIWLCRSAFEGEGARDVYDEFVNFPECDLLSELDEKYRFSSADNTTAIVACVERGQRGQPQSRGFRGRGDICLFMVGAT